MKKIQTVLQRLYRDEEGASAVEYGVLVALIIAACVVVIGILGGQISSAFQSVADALSNT